jgi:O-methyltransferase
MTDTLVSKLQFSLHRWMSRLSYGMTTFRYPLRRDMWRTCRQTVKEIPTASTTPLECSEIWQWTRGCEKVAGDLAEVGVYKGTTAALLLRASSKKLHLFDTFQGLPDSEGQFEEGEWKASLDTVKRNLSRWEARVEYHVGLFPESATGVDARFSFVHLDMDLYAGTKAALEWFWPRLSKGGAILSHDYPLSDGVVRAFHEFFDSRPEPFVPLSGGQCVAVKLD